MQHKQHYTFGFLLEQTLGHRTHSQNLQTNVPKDPTIQPVWGPIEWDVTGVAAHLPLYNRNWTIRAGLRTRRLMARIQRQTPVDAYFIHTQVPAVLVSDWMRQVPTIVSLDATPQQYDALGAHYAHQQGPAWVERLKWRLNARCFTQARHLVAWSQWTKSGLMDEYGVPAAKVTVIPPGVTSHEWLRPTARTQHEGPVRILFVGGDLRRKGGELLLDAYRTLRQQMTGIDGWPRLELHLVTRDSVADEPGVFAYHTMQPNSAPLKALFHRCDIFCLPTYGDCLPMVLSEAGAAGLPLVATNIGGISEIVKHGENGFLSPVGDGTALIKALQKLIMTPALRLAQGEQAVALIRRDFDAERNTNRLLELMKQCVDEAIIPAANRPTPRSSAGRKPVSV